MDYGGDVVGKGLSEANDDDDDDDNTTVWWHLREETDIQIEIEILKQDFTLCLRWSSCVAGGRAQGGRRMLLM